MGDVGYEPPVGGIGDPAEAERRMNYETREIREKW